MSMTIGDLNVEIGARLDKLDRGLNQMESKLKKASTKGISPINKGLSKMAGLAIAAFSVEAIISFGAEAVKLAAQMEGVEKGFLRVGGTSKIMDELKTATRGAVSELELMQQTTKAANFNIGLKELPKLLEFASRRAQETGESVDYLVNSIVTGIGRKSPLILDNLGITTARLKDEFNGAALEAQSVADVSAAVGRIADFELSKMGDAIVTSADEMARLTANWTNFKTRLGDTSSISGGVTFLADFTEEASNLIDVLGAETIGLDDKLFALMSGPQYREMAKAAARAEIAVKKLNKERKAELEILRRAESEYKDFLLRKKEADEEARIKSANEALKEQIKLYDILGVGNQVTNQVFKGNVDSTLSPIGMEEEEVENLDHIREALDNMSRSAEVAGMTFEIMGAGLSNVFLQGLEGTKSFGQAFTDFIGSMIKQLISAIASAALLSVILAGLGFGAFGTLFKQGLGLGGAAAGAGAGLAAGGAAGTLQLVGLLQGDNIRISNKRAGYNNNRVR